LNRSPLKYYGQTNIASRPTQRNQSDSFSFEDLRAIPFVGAWSQIKQNVPGFYGLGTALKELEKQGRLNELIDLFHKMDLFRAIITNSMQSMSKSNFDLTRYMEKDAEFGEFWCLIHDEFEVTLEMVLKVSGQSRLLEDNHRSRRSIHLREKIVLPVLTIQQYALMKLQDPEISKASTEQYDKMVLRSLFGIINATRNSV
jgi:phosphoenolpyruvate carboxylase